MKNKYNWVAEWRFDKNKFLRVDDCGIVGIVAYVSKNPTYFRTKEECKKWTRGWIRGSFKVYKVENK